MKVKFLSDHPLAIATLAEWYFDEWGHLSENNSIEKMANEFRSYLN